MVIAAIVAGGSGARMGANTPKQFLPLNDKPIIIHTIERFLAVPQVDGIALGLHPDWVDATWNLLKQYGIAGPNICITPGGADRSETLYQTILAAERAFGLQGGDVILSHDAVRPFVSTDTIEANINAVQSHGACTTVAPATDTLLHGPGGEWVQNVPKRVDMFHAQTPQSFTAGLYKSAYENIPKDVLPSITDACALFLAAGQPVFMVPGEPINIKITTPLDYQLAQWIVQHP